MIARVAPFMVFQGARRERRQASKRFSPRLELLRSKRPTMAKVVDQLIEDLLADVAKEEAQS